MYSVTEAMTDMRITGEVVTIAATTNTMMAGGKTTGIATISTMTEMATAKSSVETGMTIITTAVAKTIVIMANKVTTVVGMNSKKNIGMPHAISPVENQATIAAVTAATADGDTVTIATIATVAERLPYPGNLMTRGTAMMMITPALGPLSRSYEGAPGQVGSAR